MNPKARYGVWFDGIDSGWVKAPGEPMPFISDDMALAGMMANCRELKTYHPYGHLLVKLVGPNGEPHDLDEEPTNSVDEWMESIDAYSADIEILMGMTVTERSTLAEVIHHLIARELGRAEMTVDAPLTPFGEVAAQLAAACRLWLDNLTPGRLCMELSETALAAYDALMTEPEKEYNHA